MKFAPALALTLLAAAFAARADIARAEDAPRILRLIGDAPAAKTGAPRRFVLDLRIKPGDGEFQSAISGWFAGLDDTPPYGGVDGSCVEKHCALTVQVEDGKLALTGDFLDTAGPVAARITVKDEDDKVVDKAAVTLRPLSGPIAGVGALADPGAVDAAELEQLLTWNQQNGPTGQDAGDPPSDSQRETLADWQKSKGRTGTGLILAGDLAELRSGAAAARKAAGWTALGDKAPGGKGVGWSAGYPAAVLPRASHAGAEQRFASADGKALLVVALDPPMTGEAFDALVERETGDHPEREGVNYTRVNADMDLRYEEKGVVHVMAWHNRDGALARLSYTYPTAGGDAYSTYDTIIPSSFKVSDEAKR
ncbi:MAG: hypothetical protein JSR86_15865 [Proteobacteria bacterium]|nr:hypothetical protein [Pseudomonadota bacterium]